LLVAIDSDGACLGVIDRVLPQPFKLLLAGAGLSPGMLALFALSTAVLWNSPAHIRFRLWTGGLSHRRRSRGEESSTGRSNCMCV